MAALPKLDYLKEESLPLLIKNNYLYVGNGGTETTISWSCFIEDYKTEISYKPWNGSSFCWRIWDRSTYNKLEMSWAGQPSKFVFSIILCRQIWCDIMFSEYNWKPVHKFDLVKEFDNNKKQLNIIKTLYRRTIHSNVYRQNVIQADCQTGKMLYRRMCTERMCTRRMCTRRMCTWRMCTRQMCTYRRMSTRRMSARRKCTRQNVTDSNIFRKQTKTIILSKPKP